jgi:carboxylesterase type B
MLTKKLLLVSLAFLVSKVTSSNDNDFDFVDDAFDDFQTPIDFDDRDEKCPKSPANYSRSRNRQTDVGVIIIDGGYIKGEETTKGYFYRGIPYAKPPIGDMRFEPPQTYGTTWDGIRSYTSFGPKCAQYEHFGYKFSGEEDCLTLNVFVPQAVMHGMELVPVVFYIHGGAFMFGGSVYFGAENFMDDKRMIVVTVNYRLGILGFLSTMDEKIPGNFGLKDQVEALRWVRRNIVAFKGDPNYIVLSGFSAGAASVHLHYMSPLTMGLFRSGISHSGNALDPWVMQEMAGEKTAEVSARFGCHLNPDPTWLKRCLQGVPVKELVTFASHFQPFLYNPFSPFGVVVEKPSPTAFLIDSPKNLMATGKLKNLPWILSQTKDEGLYPAAEFVEKTILSAVDRKWIDIAPYLLDYVSVLPDFKNQSMWSLKIRERYFKKNKIDLRRFFSFRQVMVWFLRDWSDSICASISDDDRSSLPQWSIQQHKASCKRQQIIFLCLQAGNHERAAD